MRCPASKVNGKSKIRIFEKLRTLTLDAGLPADLKSQGNLIFFQGQGIVREF